MHNKSLRHVNLSILRVYIYIYIVNFGMCSTLQVKKNHPGWKVGKTTIALTVHGFSKSFNRAEGDSMQSLVKQVQEWISMVDDKFQSLSQLKRMLVYARMDPHFLAT